MMYGIDFGHGGKDPGAMANGLTEKDLVLAVGQKLLSRLNQLGIPYAATRLRDQDVPLASRVALFNLAGVKAVISLHFNSFSTPEPRGYEAFHQANNAQSKLLAEHVVGQLSLALGPVGVPPRKPPLKTRLNPDGTEYYYLLRELRVPTVIVEPAFISNIQDAEVLRREQNLDAIADALADAITGFEGGKPPVPVTEPAPPQPEPPVVAPEPPAAGLTPIMGPSVATLAQTRAWIDRRAQTSLRWLLYYLADAFWRHGAEYGVRGDIGFCQFCKETGFAAYGGLVRPWQCNTGGLGATGRAGEPLRPDGTRYDDPLFGADPLRVRFEPTVHGAIFAGWETGVEAHIQHLYAYATDKPLPTGKILLSPRFALVRRGSAPYVEWLGAGENPAGVGWAYPGLDYGRSIIRDYLADLLATPGSVDGEVVPVAEYQRVVAELEAARRDLEEARGDLEEVRERLARIREIVCVC